MFWEQLEPSHSQPAGEWEKRAGCGKRRLKKTAAWDLIYALAIGYGQTGNV